jgi:hypothetical protein
MQNLLTFPNQVSESKSVDSIPKYHNFSDSTLAKSSVPEKMEKSKNLKYQSVLKKRAKL